MLVTKAASEKPTDRSIKSLNKYFQLTNSVGMVYINSDERLVFCIWLYVLLTERIDYFWKIQHAQANNLFGRSLISRSKRILLFAKKKVENSLNCITQNKIKSCKSLSVNDELSSCSKTFLGDIFESQRI